MYYYTFKDDSELTRENVVKTLESLGYKKSEYSCDLKEVKGIAIYSSCFGDNVLKVKKYIFLSEDMMRKNPRTSWIEPYREEVKELIDFYNLCRDLA